MNRRQKALVSDMFRIIFWGAVMLLLLWVFLNMVQFGLGILADQPPVICSGSPDDCARWAP